MKATLVLFSKKLLWRNISTLHLYKEPLSRSNLKATPISYYSRVYYCKSNMGFKMFDSHARNLYGRGQPQGTYVFLEVLSLDILVHYFQSIHNNDII